MRKILHAIREIIHGIFHSNENQWIDYIYGISAEEWQRRIDGALHTWNFPGQPTKEGDITHMSPLDEQ